MACLFAKKGELTADPAEKAAYEDKAMSYFNQALSSIKAYKVPTKAGGEKADFVKNYKKGSSDPCAAARASLWEWRNPDDDYSAMLASVDN